MADVDTSEDRDLEDIALRGDAGGSCATAGRETPLTIAATAKRSSAAWDLMRIFTEDFHSFCHRRNILAQCHAARVPWRQAPMIKLH